MVKSGRAGVRLALSRALSANGLKRNWRRLHIGLRDVLAPAPEPTGVLGVLAIMKNETLNLREWLEHYRWQGAQKVFLIDNGSTDGPLRLIEEDIREGFVEYFDRPARHAQNEHYCEVFRTTAIARKVRWLAMADLDEFWYAPSGTLKTVLEGYDPRARVIYANWKMFGSNGHDAHPPSVRRGFTKRHSEPAPFKKWICRTDCITGRDQLRVHRVDGVPRSWVRTDNENFQLNHYVVQSRQFYTTVKMTRGDVHRAKDEEMRDLATFEACDRDATVEDHALAQMVAALSPLAAETSERYAAAPPLPVPLQPC